MMKNKILFTQLPALGVHLFTASGILAGFMAILAIQEKDWQAAAVWLFICQVVDGVDGTFARYFNVEKTMPGMDGKVIDQIIDFVTYAVIPALFFYHSELAPHTWRLPAAFAMLISAAMYYGKKGMVSEEMHFIGFPVLWNVVVFFLFFVFRLSPAINTGLIFVFAALHFVPFAYPYPTRALEYRTITLIISVAALIAAALTVWVYPIRNNIFSGILMIALVYYAFLMWRINKKIKRSPDGFFPGYS
jgi:phosphatidylcholine synthase